MEILKKYFSLNLGCVIISAVIALFLTIPAFATTTSTASAPYTSGSDTVSTSTSVEDYYHFYDLSLEIDVTYTWEEDLEWVFLKHGQSGFWAKGANGEDALNYINLIQPTKSYQSIDDIDDWEWLSNVYNNFYNRAPLCKTIKIENNGGNRVGLRFEEETKILPETVISGEPVETAFINPPYLQYRFMKTYTRTTTTNVTNSLSADASLDYYQDLVIWTETTLNNNDVPHNEVIIGIHPSSFFNPLEYAQWIPENKKDESGNLGELFSAKLKLIFKKVAR